jgi:hypothetical protein
MSAAQQPSFFVPSLPERFVSAFRAVEVEAGVDAVTLAGGNVLRDSLGHWWIEVRANSRTFGLFGRADLEVAARDLFAQVHRRAAR